MRDQRDTYDNAAYDRDVDRSPAGARYREDYDSVYRGEERYDSHYDEGEDPVAFVNVIDMDIPFFQLVWLIFKIMLAAIVAGGFLYLLGVALHWVLSLPQIQQLLPDGASWLNSMLGRN